VARCKKLGDKEWFSNVDGVDDLGKSRGMLRRRKRDPRLKLMVIDTERSTLVSSERGNVRGGSP